MDTIKNIENYLDANIIAFEGLQESAKVILEGLKQMKTALASPTFKMDSIPFSFNPGQKSETELKVSKVEVKSLSIKELYADYPHNGKFSEKIKYLDSKIPIAWRMPEREQLIMLIEGPENGTKTIKNMSQKLKQLVYNDELISAKYNNSNKQVFYVRPEWRSNEKNPRILESHAPASESFGTLDVDKRNAHNITWITSRKRIKS